MKDIEETKMEIQEMCDDCEDLIDYNIISLKTKQYCKQL